MATPVPGKPIEPERAGDQPPNGEGTALAPSQVREVDADAESMQAEVVQARGQAYLNIMTALSVSTQGDVDQTRRLVENARELIKRGEIPSRAAGEGADQKYFSSLQAMAEAFVPIAETLEAYHLLDFELAGEKQKQAKGLLDKAVKKFDEEILDSAFWRDMCVYLRKFIEVQTCQFISDKALYSGDFATCALWLKKSAALYDKLRWLVPTPPQEGPIDPKVLGPILGVMRDQIPRQSRLLSHKARMVQQYAALATKPSWKMRMLFFVLWLISIALVAAIAKWTGMQVTGGQLLWWSALSAGVAAGLLELGEWLAFLRKKEFQESFQKSVAAMEEFKG